MWGRRVVRVSFRQTAVFGTIGVWTQMTVLEEPGREGGSRMEAKRWYGEKRVEA